MKAVFGLAGVLVTLGVIVWIMGGPGGTLDQTSAALKARDKAQREMAPLTGANPNGGRIADTISLEAQRPTGSRITGLLVARLEPNNALIASHGLQKFDLITKVNQMPVNDLGEDMAEAQVLESAGRKWQLTVLRNNQELNLPLAPGSAPPIVAPGAGMTGMTGGTDNQAAPQQPPQQATPAPSGDPIRRQLEAIQKTPTH